MTELLSSSTLNIIAPAFLAGLLVLTTHVLLGREVLRKGIIFIDLAVAQAAATGALFTSILLETDASWQQQLYATAAALLMVTGLHQLEKRWPTIQEPLIGASFVLLACVAMLVTASDPHGGEHMNDLMAGQILWSSNDQLIWLGIACVVSLVCMLLFARPLFRFYIPFAIAITAAVQVVGVYLVFASLIFPALVCRNLPRTPAFFTAFATGASGYASGLIASVLLDLPSGPTVVVALACSSMIAGGIRYLAVPSRFRYNRQHP